MAYFLFLVGVLQCVVLYYLGKTGDRLAKMGEREWDQVRYEPEHGWPSCALIVPVSGSHPAMGAALASIAEQNYPDFAIYLVTSTRDDPAVPLIELLGRQYGNIRHVVAGVATERGQKNHNLLAGVAAAGEQFEVYAFCDSTHIAREDFLRCLLLPLARREASFTTGYHEVEPGDQGIVTLAYALSVLFMHFMQGMPALTQPWGGAMAMTRQAFSRYNVAELWQTTVVDDCSLGALLTGEGVHVRLCAGAILRTQATGHAFPVWHAWLRRQILFLKFCMKSEWLSLGAVCVLMVVPPLWCAIACLSGIIGIGGGTEPFLALCWFCALGWTIGSWRRFLLKSPAITRWIRAFFCASFMFAAVYLGTFGSRTLLWNNILYQVGRNGRVTGVQHR